jgi:hypothetical protein
MLAGAAALAAACSRNPKPNVDETGRADTTAVTDTLPTPVNPSVTPTDTSTPGVVPDTGVYRTDTLMRRDTSTVIDSSWMRRDTSVVQDSSWMRRDTSAVNDTMPYPRNMPDTTNRPPSP